MATESDILVYSSSKTGSPELKVASRVSLLELMCVFLSTM